MNVVSAGKIPAIADNTVSSVSPNQSLKATLRENTPTEGKLLRTKPFQDFDIFVTADRTEYHLLSSKHAIQRRYSELSEGLLFSRTIKCGLQRYLYNLSF